MMVEAWCCKCDKPVDELVVERFDYLSKTNYIVRCHGEEQSQELPLVTVLGTGIVTSITINAFRDVKALE